MTFIFKLLLLVLFGGVLAYAAALVSHHTWVGILVFLLFAVSKYRVIKR